MEKKKQFLPALLERLLDDEPKKHIEPHDKFFYDSRTMRKLVQRNISEILNNANIEDRLDPQRHKWVATSVLNYGISPWSGFMPCRIIGRLLNELSERPLSVLNHG